MLVQGLRRQALQPSPAFPCFRHRFSASLSTWQSNECAERFNQIVENPVKPPDPKEKALARGLAFLSDFKRLKDVQPSARDRWEPVPGLRIWTATRHSVPHRSMHFMEWPGHVLVDKLLDTFAEKSRTTPLWIMPDATSQADTRTKAVVRLTQERRLRVALLQALQMHGYDKQGRKLKPYAPVARSAPRPAYARRGDPDELYGMVKLSCVAVQIANFPMDKMVAHFVRLVERLKDHLGCRAGERPEVDGQDESRASRPKNYIPGMGTREELPRRSIPRDDRSRDSGGGRPYAQQGLGGSSYDRNSRGRNGSYWDAEDDEWKRIMSIRRS